MNKLQISERTVESLHEQLSQMNHSDAIERARDQHDAVLSAANDRHELHVLELTTQLDDLRQQKTDVVCCITHAKKIFSPFHNKHNI